MAINTANSNVCFVLMPLEELIVNLTLPYVDYELQSVDVANCCMYAHVRYNTTAMAIAMGLNTQNKN